MSLEEKLKENRKAYRAANETMKRVIRERFDALQREKIRLLELIDECEHTEDISPDEAIAARAKLKGML